MTIRVPLLALACALVALLCACGSPVSKSTGRVSLSPADLRAVRAELYNLEAVVDAAGFSVHELDRPLPPEALPASRWEQWSDIRRRHVRAEELRELLAHGGVAD